MQIQNITTEEYASIRNQVDVIESNFYGDHELIVGHHETAGLVVLLVGNAKATDSVTFFDQPACRGS